MHNNEKEKLKFLISKIVKEELSSINESYEEEVVYRAFVQPFKDVVDTAVHGLKKTGATAVANVVKLAKQTAVAFIPFLGTTVSQVGDKEQKKLESKLGQIDKEYADVLKRNWETLRTRDVSMLLFMMDPKLYLGSSLALKAPEVAFDVLDSMIDSPAVSKWHGVFKDLNTKVMPPTAGGSGGGGSGGFGSGDAYFGDGGNMGWESKTSNKPVLKEELTKDTINQKAAVTLKRLLNDRAILNKINTSPVVKEMRTSALSIFVDKAKEVQQFKNIQQFKKHFGSDFDKLYNQVSSKVEEKEEFDGQLIIELKKIFGEVIIKYLNTLKNDAPTAVQEIDKTISDIQRML